MEHQRELYQQRGYSEDLLPKTETQRNWKAFNYFTLWMGSVHNVPNYVMVGGFFILGLSTFNIMLAIIISALFIAAAMVMNGAAGSKYGVPFAMILRVLTASAARYSLDYCEGESRQLCGSAYSVTRDRWHFLF